MARVNIKANEYPAFRVRIIEQLFADNAKLQLVLPVLAKYNLVVADYIEGKK